MKQHDDIYVFSIDEITEMLERNKTEKAIRELEESAKRPLVSKADRMRVLTDILLPDRVLFTRVKKGPRKGRRMWRIFWPSTDLDYNRGKHRGFDLDKLTMREEYTFISPPVSAEQQERLRQILIKVRSKDMGKPIQL